MEFRLNDFFPSSRNTLDFIKYGSGLYLLGLLVMFLYLVQLHVLSVDLIRPQAVIIGVYVWLLADTIPKCLLILLQLFSLKPWLSNCLFVVFFLVVITVLQAWVGVLSFSNFMIAVAMVFWVALLRKPAWKKKALPVKLPSYNVYLVVVAVAVLFTFSFFPAIPQFLGGGKPITVKVYASDKAVFLSQFSLRKADTDGMIEVDLLYEGEDSYYFIQPVGDVISGIIMDYKVKKVKKDEVKKIEFNKENWITFKK